MVLLLEYVAEIYEMISTPRTKLKCIEEELNNGVPDSLQSAFTDKESKEEAKEKHKSKKKKEIVICPPTCSGREIILNYTIYYTKGA